MQISKNKVVSIDYTLTDDQGQVIDSSKGQAPLAYIHGAGNIIPGLEDALEGKQQGDALNVTVAPENGYGMRNEELLQVIPRDRFVGVEDLAVGMQFQAEGQHGPQVVTITSIVEDDVTIDANHPLAGVTLNFDVEIVGVREANGEELEHGHVHGEGGHQH